jgi:hypothetical protein
MIDSILAGFVVAVHFAWIIFLVLGLPVLAALNLRRLRIFHLASLAGTAAMQAAGTVCPLTLLEAALRTNAQDSVYPGRFITEFLESIIYVDDSTLRTVQVLTLLLLAATALSFLFRPLPKRKTPENRA